MSGHNTLWSGRYEQQAAESLRRLNDSYPFDKRLYADDIVCSIAYAQALGRAGLLTESEVKKITEGLELVWREFDAGLFLLKPSDEDVHTAVERRLTELIGAPAGKLHTGRSRNDQIATDVRHWLLATVRRVQQRITELQRALLAQAKRHVETLMPGYTHLRAAQPITAGHWLMSYFWMLTRDTQRLDNVFKQCAVSPLGSGALAGTPYPVDRQTLAEAMGFESITLNSLDGVSDRDFIVDFVQAAALLMVHLSRFAEDVIIYTSPQFGYIQLDERYTTGSSIMPQKQNPDVLELARGKAGRIAGHLSGLLNTFKGLPSTYNKDLQEDKEPLFDTADTLETLLPALTGLVTTMKLDPLKLREGLDEGMLATDVADYLVARGVPFREAHGIVGKLVRRSIDTNTPLSKLPLEDYTTVSPLFEDNVFELYDYAASAAKRSAPGGTAPRSVRAQIEQAEAQLQTTSSST